MKRALSAILLLALLLAGVSAVLTSCGSENTETGANIHVFLSGRLYDFDPTGAIVDDEAAQVLSLMYEPLFTLNKDGSVNCALAEDYEIDKSAHTLTITLRHTNWSNSKPVTSNDIIFAWQRILAPDFENQAAALLYDVNNALYVKQGSDPDGKTMTIADLGLEAPDNKTLIITFRGDIDYKAFLRNLSSVALAPSPENTVSNALRADNWSKRVATIVTNGAFTLKSLDYQSGEFTLKRNQYYRRDKGSDTALTEYVVPQFLTTTWQTSDMTAEKYNEFLNSKITVHYAGDDNIYADSLYYISELPVAVRQAKTFEKDTVTNDLMSVSTVVLNTKYGNPALANANIRQALSAVVDRAALAAQLVYARPANGFVTPGVFEAGKSGTDFRSVGGALLTATRDESEVYLTRGMSELGITDKALLGELRLMYSGDSTTDAYTASFIKTAWESLGFTVKLDPLYGEQRTIGEDTVVLDSAIQKNYNAHWNDIRLTAEQIAQAIKEEKALADALTADPVPETLPVVTVDRFADAILIDYQMMSTDPFVALAGFSTAMSGNGFDKTDISEDGSHEYSYAAVPHVSGYENTAYDTLITSAYNETNATKRAEFLHNAEQMLLSDMPVIPLIFNQDYYVLSGQLTDVKTNAYGLPVFMKAYLTDYDKLEKPENESDTAN